MTNPGYPQTLQPWVEGQSGNPEGSSKKLRGRKSLRDYMRDELDTRARDSAAEELLTEDMIEDAGSVEAALKQYASELTLGRAVARKIAQDSLRDNPKVSQKARDQIIAMEPKTIEVDSHIPPLSPDYIPSERDQQELLGAAQASEYVH